MRLILLPILLIFTIQSFALDASVSYATFKGKEANYIEMYLYLVGSTLEFKALDSLNRQANIEVTFIFKQGEEIVKFDKYSLLSPISKSKVDFIDLKRYPLENGQYSLEVNIVDLNNVENTKSLNTPKIVIDYSDDKLYMSDIQLLSACDPSTEESPFVKNGLKMETVPFNFYNKNLSKLIFCTEIYNSDTALGNDYMISYFVQLVSNLQKDKDVIIGHKRRTPSEKDVFILPVDISKLGSGNYKLKVEIRNREKELITSKAVMFQRSNPYLQEDFSMEEDFDISSTFVEEMDQESLRYALKALAPKLGGADNEILNMVIKSKDLKKMKSQLFAYWANKAPINPKIAFDKYMEVAKAVDIKFKSGFGYGFETDRGFTFLKYGKPTNLITVVDEVDAPPYEIWFYDDFPFTGQSNVRFLFYNPSLAAGQFILLHSTARGEVSNPIWAQTLYNDAREDAIQGKDYLNGNGITDGLSNRNAARYFNDF